MSVCLIRQTKKALAFRILLRGQSEPSPLISFFSYKYVRRDGGGCNLELPYPYGILTWRGSYNLYLTQPNKHPEHIIFKGFFVALSQFENYQIAKKAYQEQQGLTWVNDNL